jgi:Cu/Ag efflux pump CusA
MLNAIVDASLRYKVLVLVAFAVLVGLGVMAYRQVPVDAFPDVTPAQVNIYTESPGVAAEDIEKLLTVPIEAAMAGLPGRGRSARCRCSACPTSASTSRTTSTSTSRAAWWARSCRR